MSDDPKLYKKTPKTKENETFYVNLTGPLLHEFKLLLIKENVSANYFLNTLIKKRIHEERRKANQSS